MTGWLTSYLISNQTVCHLFVKLIIFFTVLSTGHVFMLMINFTVYMSDTFG